MRRTLLLLAGLLPALATAATAQVPPHGAWRTIESPHFRVTYEAGLDELARHAAERAEAAHARLAVELTRPPSGRIDIVLADNVDFTNGYATPFPSNRIVVYARPPADVQGLEFNRDWIELVITHELTHIFHLDRAGRFGMALRNVFGRLPLLWPMFPAAGTPRWSIEGLATHVESDFTGMGRVYGTYHEMVVRTAVLEDRFDPLDRATASSPIWPGDERAYIYGSLFFDYLAEQYGEDVRTRLIDNTASAVIPPILWFGRVGKRTLGKTFGAAYDAWREEVRARYGRLADSLRATRLTERERVTTHGRWALHPRVSPDGTRLAYTAQENDGIVHARVIQLASGETVRQVRRNGIGSLGWLPRGDAFLYSQLEFDGPYHILQDLYIDDEGRRIRLTDGARVQDPDADYHGERFVAVEYDGGTNRVIVLRNSDRSLRAITAFDPDVNWALPRWSPDGTRIAAGRWQSGEYDVVVIDTLGSVVHRLTADRAIDATPDWSPDGRYIVFSSDRTGIPNLYAADLQGGEPVIRQVTNVLGGALHPDVSPDGRWIYYSDYHADGWHVARIPFDPARWRPLPPLRPVVAGDDGAVLSAPSATPPPITTPRAYSALPSLLPTFWAPVLYAEGADTAGAYIGAASAGVDLLGRHAWSAFVAVNGRSDRWEASLDYTFAGLGNPLIDVRYSRDWEPTIGVVFDDSIFRDADASEDVASLSASFLRPRWRSSAVLTAGVEGVLVRRQILDPPVPGARHPDERDELFGVFARAGYASYRTPPYAISREDGVSVSIGGRVRRERAEFVGNEQGYEELTGLAAGYKSLALPGFAHHVAALRASGLVRTGDGAEPTRIGGAPGGVLNALGLGVAGGSLLLPVRGFERGVRRGTTAWTASAEYRLPLALVGRRPKLSPLYIDRISGSLFLDTGDAWCTGNAAARFRACEPRFGGATGPRTPLLAAGAELSIDAALAAVAGGRIRVGVGVPLRGPTTDPLVHLQFGSAF